MEDKYEQIKKLGNGAFGTAYLCKDRATGENVVMKVVNISKMNINMQRLSAKEVSVLKTFDHPNIVRYIDSKADRGQLYIIMEYADSSDMETMLRAQRDRAPLSEDTVLEYFLQIALGLKHIHGKKILHRDLKTQNIFMSSTRDGSGKLVAKIGDFGISKVLKQQNEITCTFAGTPQYMAPEMFQRRGYNNKSDVWSLGCILYELCTCNKLFKYQTMNEIMQHVLSNKTPKIDQQRYSADIQAIIDAALQKDPQKRPSINGLLRIDFLQRKIADIVPRDIIIRDFTPSEATRILSYAKESATLYCSAATPQNQLIQQIKQQNQFLEQNNKPQPQQAPLAQQQPANSENQPVNHIIPAPAVIQPYLYPQQVQQPANYHQAQQANQLVRQKPQVVKRQKPQPQQQHVCHQNSGHGRRIQQVHSAEYQQKLQQRERQQAINREQQRKEREARKLREIEEQQMQLRQLNEQCIQMNQQLQQQQITTQIPAIEQVQPIKNPIYVLPPRQELQLVKARNNGFLIPSAAEIGVIPVLEPQNEPVSQNNRSSTTPAQQQRADSEPFSDSEPFLQNADNINSNSKQQIVEQIGLNNFEELQAQIRQQILTGQSVINPLLYKNDEEILMQAMKILMFEK